MAITIPFKGTITRQIYLTEHSRIEPIQVAYGSNIPIRLEFMDYIFNAGLTYSLTANATAEGYDTVCVNPSSAWENYLITTDGSNPAVHVWPQVGFFRPGKNDLQIKLDAGSYNLITFHIPVICETDIGVGDRVDATEITPLVERAESAANMATTTVASYIKVSEEQPTESGNKIWIDSSSDGNEITLLTEDGVLKLIREQLGVIENGTY